MNRIPASHRTSLPAFTVRREKHGGFTSHYTAALRPFGMYVGMYGSSASLMVTLSMRTQREYWSDTLQRKYT